MSDTKSGDDKTLSVNTKKTLTLKRPGIEQGTVRQNFSHGRTKSVVVETKKRKFSMPGDKPEAAAAVSVFTPKPPVARRAPRRRAGSAEGRAPLVERSRHGAERPVDQRDRSAPPRARRLEGPRGRGSPARDRGGQAPRSRRRSAASASARNPRAARPRRKRACRPRPNRAAAPRKRRAAARRSPTWPAADDEPEVKSKSLRPRRGAGQAPRDAGSGASGQGRRARKTAAAAS